MEIVRAADLVLDSTVEWLVLPVNCRLYEQEENRLRASNEIPIVTVWRNIVIGEFLQYRICKKLDRNVLVCPIRFETQTDVITHVCWKELERSDLPSFWRRYLIGRLYGFIRDQGGRIADDSIGLQLGLTQGTYAKYRYIARAFDCLADTRLSSAVRIRRGASYFSFTDAKRYLAVLSGKQKEKTVPTFSVNVASKTTEREKSRFVPQIKQMPQANPFALLQTLKFTMASWTPVIDKAVEGTGFEAVPKDLAECIRNIAIAHRDAVTRLLDSLEDISHEPT